MKHFACQLLVISSVFCAARLLMAETRPQYGGTLHLSTRDVVNSLDPLDEPQDSLAARNISLLLFDTLCTVDDNGRVHSGLATSWQTSHNNQHWRFHLRKDVHFHDGTPLTAEAVTGSLRAANPSWNVVADGDSIVIEREYPDPEMPSELSLPRNAIWKKSSDNLPAGTGPFRLADWQPGKKLTVAANEDYWGGRPFLDAIEIEIGKNFRDQMTALEMGKFDVIEVSPEQARRAPVGGRELIASSPIELVALVFAHDAQNPEDKLSRDALSLSIDRESIRNVIMQGSGQPAGCFLPNWISGYAFVFSTRADLSQARRERDQLHAIPNWSLGYDSHDPTDRLLAERIALNAKDAGLRLQLTSSANADLRLVRIPLTSSDPWIALERLANSIGTPLTKHSGTVEELYGAEQALLASKRAIPLFHLPAIYALSPTLNGLTVLPDGTLSVVNAWLGVRQP